MWGKTTRVRRTHTPRFKRDAVDPVAQEGKSGAAVGRDVCIARTAVWIFALALLVRLGAVAAAIGWDLPPSTDKLHRYDPIALSLLEGGSGAGLEVCIVRQNECIETDAVLKDVKVDRIEARMGDVKLRSLAFDAGRHPCEGAGKEADALRRSDFVVENSP